MPNNKAANRLINEKSPYLLQHAYNPVNWYPWTEEAFIKAKEEDKPIFLSIGYSTCHWCHVMERESFEDEDVAKVLNEDYICIKVDREERPDVDSIYMSYCQAITGRGGWPLTIIMTPDKKPFFAGTYFPKESKYGKPGIIEILKAVTLQWRNKREQVLSYSSNLLIEIKKTFVGEDKEELNEEILINTFEGLTKAFDNRYGGFYNAPKFPTPHKLMYLLRMWKVYGYKEALYMFEKTLDGMYKGGMFDHIGFGFSRYSTDKMWLAPHFEKMLYDNALLALVYAEAYAETKNAKYKDVCEKIFWYLEDKMISREGGLYSAEDADSEGVEGKFYLWTPKEVKEILGEEDGAYFCNYFDITEKGNFEGKNIANLIKKSLDEMEEKDLKKLNSLREKLYSYREKRVHPHKDDKILTSWNGLAIVAFAYAGRVFHNKYYIELGEKALDFILKNLTREDGRLLARYRDGEAAYLAYLDDYAFLTWGLLELYEATFKGIYLEKATHFNKKMIDLYWDDEDSGFYIYGKDGEELLMRPKESFDNAIPSGNSIGINNMLRLSNINEDMELKEKAESALKIFSYNIKQYPEAHLFMLINLMYIIKGNNKIVIEGKLGEEALNTMIEEINNRFNPFADIKLEVKEGKGATAYVCKNFTCSSPVTTIEDFIKLI